MRVVILGDVVMIRNFTRETETWRLGYVGIPVEHERLGKTMGELRLCLFTLRACGVPLPNIIYEAA